ncbi:hypothetical protein Acsp06_39120 [Actinomycetospora sp. NBRC 106375]|uniref:hypothetical protein n=1 Tax=Actinomycetospora sp. NBRC 106375 TaxID=3032207 RepID=UPI0024A4C70B|nr:hypothetical protein [Actinomycetospora sp. NBRC 106375]GLZ47727.1 hypothetical protein Acsp06_39120 [Actinomycetospora sp. NBRC 106375]
MSGTDESGGTTRDDAAAQDHAAEDGERAGTAVGVADRGEFSGTPSASEDSATESDASTSDDGTEAAEKADTTETADTTGKTGTGATASDDEDDEDDDPAGTVPASSASGDDDLDDTVDDDDEDDEDAPRRPWLTIALGAVAAAAIIALAVTSLIIPGWAVKPGSPDSVAERVSTALATKNPSELEAVSCHNQQGQATNPFPPDALQIIQSARPAGPPRLELDTQAVAPMDLTLSAQGQTQNLPADIVLAVTDGDWCMAGVSQRQ